jgi:hypothetical protein
VLPAVHPSEESLLSRVGEIDNSCHNSTRDSSGQKSIVSVGYTQRARVREEARSLFGQEKEQAVIVAFRRGVSFRNGLQHPQKDWGCKFWGCSPGGKRDPIWARGGVIGTLNGL